MRFETRTGTDNSIEYRAYPRILYSYQINSRRHTNETQKPSYYEGGGFAYANRMMHRFQPGATVNPANPYDSELEGMEQEEAARNTGWLAKITISAGILLMVAGTVMTVNLAARQRKAAVMNPMGARQGQENAEVS